MISVEKIGGTSMSRFDDVLRNIILRDQKHVYGRVYVVSAYAGVTNKLLEHKKTGQPGVYATFVSGGDYGSQLESFTGKLKAINKEFGPLGLDLASADTFLEKRMKELRAYLDSMRHVLASGYLRRESVLLAAREMLAAIGEAHSAFNSVEDPAGEGCPGPPLDLSGFDDDDPLTIDERIHKSFQGVDLENRWWSSPATPRASRASCGSSTAATPKSPSARWPSSSRRTRPSSTRSSTCPRQTPRLWARRTPSSSAMTNYDVADQLADVGMEAIHPKAAKPMELAGIAIRLKNTFEPDHPGTLITKAYVGTQARIEVIAGSQKVTAMEIHDPSMVGTVGFDHGMMEIFQRSRDLLHPQGDQRQLHHARGHGTSRSRPRSSRSSRTPTRS